jgi:hypothetical protein
MADCADSAIFVSAMSKRPPRADVEAAIRATRGNLTRAAASLRCSRQALYEWIWQLGLQHLAGVDTVKRQGLKEQQRIGAGGGSVSVKLEGSGRPTLHGVMSAEAVTTDDVRMPHNVRVRDSLWTRVAHVVVDRKISMSDAVEEALTKWADEQEGK